MTLEEAKRIIEKAPLGAYPPEVRMRELINALQIITTHLMEKYEA